MSSSIKNMSFLFILYPCYANTLYLFCFPILLHICSNSNDGGNTCLFNSLDTGGFHCDFTVAQRSQQWFSVVFKLPVKSHRSIFRDSYSTRKAFFGFSYSSAKGICLPFSLNLVFTKLSLYDLSHSLSLIYSLLNLIF